MISITNRWRNSFCCEISAHIHWDRNYRKQTKPGSNMCVSRDMDKLKSLCIVGWIVKWCNLYGEQYWLPSKNYKYQYHMILSDHTSGYLPPKKWGSQRDLCTCMFIATLFYSVDIESIIVVTRGWGQGERSFVV